MPALGMAQDTGKLIRWLKREGHQVKQGEPLMEVETDKVTLEIEAPASGILANVTAREGEDIPVAQVIALILAPGESAPAPTRSAQSQPAAASTRPRSISASPVALRAAHEHQVDLAAIQPANGDRISKADVLAYAQSLGSPARPGDGAGIILASPKARRLAAERGLAIADMRGSGPGGAVLAADVPASALPPAREPTELSTVWRVMADRMTQSWTSVPHFYLTREVDASRMATWRELAQKQAEHKITYTDLLVKAVAAALEEHPRLNAAWINNTIQTNTEINVGLAVAVEEGLLVPVIHNANQLAVSAIAARRKELVTRAADGKLRLDDIQGGTFTISNLGMHGVDAFNAIVNPPQAAILAVGRIADRVVAVGGQPAVRPTMIMSLSCDHRVVDGARGAQFLDRLASLLEEPMALIR